jgi:hypothetical protein
MEYINEARFEEIVTISNRIYELTDALNQTATLAVKLALLAERKALIAQREKLL